jgi:CRP-like cAMP-binding protein
MTFFDEHPVAWSNVVSLLCERLRHTNEQMTEVAMVALPVRLAKALLRMARPGPGARRPIIFTCRRLPAGRNDE